jgi:hypothetical protein
MLEPVAFVLASGQKLASLDPPRVVHREQLDRSASNRRNTLDEWSAKMEMIGPTVAFRMEQRDNLSGHRIDASQTCLSSGCSGDTRGQIAVIVAPAMLARHDVLDVMGKGTTVLRKKTIFATIRNSSRLWFGRVSALRIPSATGRRKAAFAPLISELPENLPR